MTKRPYFTLVLSDLNGRWAIEFGDYERAAVEYEREDYLERGYKSKHLKIIRTADSLQSSINAAVAALNGSK